MQEFPDSSLVGRVRAIGKRYERRLSMLAFVGGFILDTLTLRRVDLWIENLAIAAYLLIAALGIVILNTLEGREGESRWRKRVMSSTLLAIQFSFGALFSAFFVFYSRSASLIASWPFLLFLLVLFLGNELFRKRYAQLTFQLSIFFITAFSYAIFLVPVILHSLGAHTFLLSGILGLAALLLILAVIKFAAPRRYEASRRSLFVSVTSIYFCFNVLYFLNIIPPIPLSLKEIGLYHSVARSGSEYTVTYEPVSWYDVRNRLNPVFHRFQNEPLYIFSAIFAPTKLAIPILHRWLHYDERRAVWVEASTIRFTISGGRDGGYRGYSYRSGIQAGRWRVDIITERGQVIGRVAFTIKDVPVLPRLVTATR